MHEAVWPASSTAVAVTVVRPRGKVEPDAGSTRKEGAGSTESLTATAKVTSKSPTGEKREAVQVANVVTLGTPRAVGRALDVQRDPVVASNGSEPLIVHRRGGKHGPAEGGQPLNERQREERARVEPLELERAGPVHRLDRLRRVLPDQRDGGDERLCAPAWGP